MKYRPQHRALDRLGYRLGWERLPFWSWRVRGWTIAVGAKGFPYRKYIASRGDEIHEFDSLDALRCFVLSGRLDPEDVTPKA
jgi:hypothetical protein